MPGHNESLSLEEPQILRASAPRDGGVFDREEQPASYIDFSVLRRGEGLAEAHGVLDACGGVNIRVRIGLSRRGGDIVRIRALVMRRRADDGVEGRRQRAHDLAGLLVAGNAGYENPALRAIDRLQAGERLPDAVGRVADVNDGERVFLDDFEAAWPGDVAQPTTQGGMGLLRRC